MPEAICADGVEVLAGPEATTTVTKLSCPATMLWAQRGMFGETPGLYTAERLAATGVADCGVDVRPAVDGNHYTILLGEDAAEIVANAIRTAAIA